MAYTTYVSAGIQRERTASRGEIWGGFEVFLYNPTWEPCDTRMTIYFEHREPHAENPFKCSGAAFRAERTVVPEAALDVAHQFGPVNLNVTEMSSLKPREGKRMQAVQRDGRLNRNAIAGDSLVRRPETPLAVGAV